MEQLWVDKYAPRKLSDFIYNLESIEQLTKLSAKSTDLPHLIIEGITGIGKKTVAMAFIKECIDQFGLNGNEVYKTHNIDISLKYPNKKIELNIQKSHYHYNVNPSDYGIYDRHIVQDFLKSQFRYKSLTGFPYKNVIIRNAENLSQDAQQSLRRTLENCIKNCRFIFIVNTEKQGTLIAPLYSRCIRIRLSNPTPNEAVKVTQSILRQEKIQIDDRLIRNLYKKSHCNLSRALGLLQLLYVMTDDKNALASRTNVNLPDLCPITKACNDIVMKMFTSKNLMLVHEIRQTLYILLTHGVNSEDIVKLIFKIVIRNLVGHELKVIKITDEIELQLKKSSREFYHLENYVVQLLFLVKKFQINQGKKKHPPLTTKKKIKLKLKPRQKID